MARADFSRADFCRADIPDAGPPPRRKKIMITYPIDKVVGFAGRVANLFTRNKAAMLAKGYDATQDIAAITANAAALPSSGEDQQHAKSAQNEQTTSLSDEIHAAYENASAALNTAVGRLGKRSEEKAEAHRIRSGCASKSSAAQVSAFIVQAAAFLTKYKDKLIAANYDPTAKITELTALSTTLVTDKGTQEQAKDDRGDSTSAVLAAKDSLFELANDALETAMGLFPSDSEFVSEAKRIRVELRGRTPAAQQPPAPATQPTTAPLRAACANPGRLPTTPGKSPASAAIVRAPLRAIRTSVWNIITSRRTIRAAVRTFRTLGGNIRTTVRISRTPVRNIRTTFRLVRTAVWDTFTTVWMTRTAVWRFRTTVWMMFTSVWNIPTFVWNPRKSRKTAYLRAFFPQFFTLHSSLLLSDELRPQLASIR
jgi:hypothetical protein